MKKYTRKAKGFTEWTNKSQSSDKQINDAYDYIINELSPSSKNYKLKSKTTRFRR